MHGRWIATVVAAFAIAAAAAPTASAGQGRGHGARMFGISARRLGLTDAQQQQVKSIAQAHRDEMTAMRQRLGAARTALREATTATPVDAALVRQRRADLSAVRSDSAGLNGRVRSEMTQVLTPEQQSQLKVLRGRTRHRKRASTRDKLSK